MADTTEMRRLMTHAAGLLDDCEPMANATVIHNLGDREAMQRVLAEVAAMATASTVLRMVAAAMADDPTADTEEIPT